MFDWPEHSQTSPISTSDTAVVPLPSVTVRDSGVLLAGRSARVIAKRPSAPARALPLIRPSVAVTVSPGAAVPSIRIGWPRWMTA
jgi:hypothetical protein